MCFTPQRRALFRYLNFQTCPSMVCFVHFDLEMCFAPQRRALFRHLNFQKWSGVVCFVHFDLETCFAPQRRALFWHLNFQKCSDGPDVIFLVTFSLANVLRATMACNFSSLVWPDGSAPAALSEPTFRPSGATNHWKKHSVSWLCYLFAHLDILSSDFLLTFFWLSSDFLLTFSSLIFFLLASFFFLLFSSLLFSSLLFSDSSHLCFSSVHNIVWSLTSKLPSIIC